MCDFAEAELTWFSMLICWSKLAGSHPRQAPGIDLSVSFLGFTGVQTLYLIFLFNPELVLLVGATPMSSDPYTQLPACSLHLEVNRLLRYNLSQLNSWSPLRLLHAQAQWQFNSYTFSGRTFWSYYTKGEISLPSSWPPLHPKSPSPLSVITIALKQSCFLYPWHAPVKCHLNKSPSCLRCNTLTPFHFLSLFFFLALTLALISLLILLLSILS